MSTFLVLVLNLDLTRSLSIVDDEAGGHHQLSAVVLIVQKESDPRGARTPGVLPGGSGREIGTTEGVGELASGKEVFDLGRSWANACKGIDSNRATFA